MTKEDKLNLQLISAAVLVIVGCGLLIGGFCETCTFAGALFGVDYHYRMIFRK